MNPHPLSRRARGTAAGGRPVGRTALALGAVAGLLCLTATSWLVWPRGPAGDGELLGEAGTLARVELLGEERGGGVVREELLLVSSTGLELRALLQRPAAGGGAAGERHAAGLLLAGLQTGRQCVRRLPPGGNAVVWLSFDYPYRDPGRVPGVVAAWREVREGARAIRRTTAGMALAAAYLEGRGDVDPARVIVVGGSLGALFAVVGGAVEPRFDGVAALFGGARLGEIVERNLRLRPRWLRPVIARALNPWLGPVDPGRFAGRIAPRPLLQVNGRADDQIPRACVEALQAAAGEPKELVWVDAPHRVLGKPEMMEQVAGIVAAWMRRRGFLDTMNGREETDP